MFHFIPSYTLEGFYVGHFYIYTWGLTAAVGVLAAIFLAAKKIAQYQMEENSFWNFSFLLVISIFLGARISYILETLSYYAHNPAQIYQLWNGGFSFFGGAVGGILCGYLWSRFKKINFWELGAVFTPAWIFGLFFGRIGCFLIHDHLGKPVGLPWGIWIQGAYRHEPALYEMVLLLIIGIILYLTDKNVVIPAKAGIQKNILGFKLKNFSRAIFPLSLFLYSISRFLLDFLRADPAQGGDDRYSGLTVAQWVSILIIFIILYLVLKNSSLSFLSRIKLWDKFQQEPRNKKTGSSLSRG